MINVTKSYLPPLDEYVEYLRGIWDRVHLTNFGPLATELEKKLQEFLGVKHLFFVGNGTIAIQIAIKALDLKKEIITTPFSYVATTSAVVWEGCKPIFADIDRDTLTINPKDIENCITPDSQAILATHVYGNPCDVKAIQEISQKYNLKVIYDAAHAFGVRFNHESILNFGDISTLSFHATKLFHTIEGGAIITNNDEIAEKIRYMRTFGHISPEEFGGIGINGKNSEFHAAMGLCLLPRIDNLIERRKQISEIYDSILLSSSIRRPLILDDIDYNYSYYAIILDSEDILIRVQSALNKEQIFPRRYFYPSLSELHYVDGRDTPVSADISRRVLCLPLYHELSDSDVKYIGKCIIEAIAK